VGSLFDVLGHRAGMLLAGLVTSLKISVYQTRRSSGERAEQGPASHDLREWYSVDLQPVNHPEEIAAIDGALGELSLFHRTHGFYVPGV